MNDILNPELLWIEGRCYRTINLSNESSDYQEHDLYENEVVYTDEGNENGEDFDVEKVDDTRYRTNFHVAKHYLGSIIGKKGAIKYRIEHDTRTEIKIPNHGQTGDIFIYGPSQSNVRAARRRINMIVMSSRMKQRATHFISIPMNSTDIIKNFENFKEFVLTECLSRGLEECLFIKSSKLHLTLGVMCLMDNEERLHASKLLTEAKETVIKPLLQGIEPIRIRLQGLSYMNDDPKEIDVLYGQVKEENSSGLLQLLADSLAEHFYKAGFLNNEFGRDNVKLHVTLINSKYRNQEKSGDARNSRRPRESFDGSMILEKFGDYDFGVMELTNVHLSQRHTMGADGYYQPTCVVSCT